MPRPPKACFIHIPKTAGTTLARLIERNYRACQRQSFYNKAAIQNQLPKALQNPNIKMVYGHYFFKEDLFPPQQVYTFTFLRHPVHRVVSNYLHLKRSANPRHKEWMQGIGSLPQFLETKQAYNNQCRRLAGAQNMAAFKAAPQAALELALKRVKTLGLIGITEDFDKSLALLAHDLGWTRLRRQKMNVAPDRAEHEALVAEHGPAITAKNELDLALYQAAQQHLNQRWASLSSWQKGLAQVKNWW
jgi:hypothetical protein